MKKISLIAVLSCVGILAAGCTGGTSKVSETANVQDDAGNESSGSKSAEISGEITVSCYELSMSQTFLEEAAKQFEQKYPGTKVNIESFSAIPEVKSSEQDGEQRQVITQEDDSQGRTDYISKTSTLLMSGQGADLLAMDVLPVYKYVESGQLENIKEYMDNDADFQKSDYRENILNALEFQNGIWFLPLDYNFDYYAYDSSLAGVQQNSKFGVEQAYTSMRLIELGKSVFDGTNKIFPAPAYLQSGNGDLFSQLFRENYSSFVDLENKTANFSDGKFKEMINDIKSLADDGYIRQGLDQTDLSNLLNSATEDPTERFLFKPKNQFSLVQQTYPDPDFRMNISTSDVGNGIEDDDQIAGICSEEAGIVPFSYEQAFGMNANSSNKQTAWAFLKFLLSYEVQASPNMSLLSLPVHNEARKDRAENLYSMLLAEGGELDESQTQALEGYVDAVEALSDQINGYTIKDTTIQDMVINEMAYFFSGAKTADQVCQALQSKVELYLNE